MLAAHEKRLELEQSDAAGRKVRDESTEIRRGIKRAHLLGAKRPYGKAAKALARSPTFDPAMPGIMDRMKALYPAPADDDPVSIIPPRNFPPRPCFSAEDVRSDLSAKDKDPASGPDRAGARWVLFAANTEHIFHPDFSCLGPLSNPG